jgi:hypothetical protein
LTLATIAREMIAHATRNDDVVSSNASDFLPRTDPTLDPWVSRRGEGGRWDTTRRSFTIPIATCSTAAGHTGGGSGAAMASPWTGGQVYRVDPATGLVLVRCGNSGASSCAARRVTAGGLALVAAVCPSPIRRRGDLVVVPDDGSVAGRWRWARQPVDVTRQQAFTSPIAAVAKSSSSIRADRCGDFVPRDARLIVTPRPIAVMIDDDGAVLVADANYPRLLLHAERRASRRCGCACARPAGG